MRDVYHADISHYTVRVYSTEPPEEAERPHFFALLLMINTLKKYICYNTDGR